MRAIGRRLYFRWIARAARLLSPVRFATYLRDEGTRKLQIGAGPSGGAGWLVTDIEPPRLSVGYLDATRRYPFPDASFDYIHSEHMIEHVPYQGGLAMLRECWRVLKPGGRIRIATPDVKVLFDLYYRRDDPAATHYVRWITDRCLPDVPGYEPLFVINNAVRAWGHQFLYDANLLVDTLKQAGFVDIQPFSPGVSDDAALCGIEQHGINVGAEDINQYETMVFEARRPA